MKKPAEGFSQRLKEVRRERQQLETALKTSAPHPNESIRSSFAKSTTSTPLSHKEQNHFHAANDRQATNPSNKNNSSYFYALLDCS